MKIKIILVAAVIGSLSFSAQATMWANKPSMDFPAAAIRDCIDGRLVVQFRIVDGHPLDMAIVSSEPDGVYTDSFLKWWSEYDKWRRQVGMRWGEDTAVGDIEEFTFTMRPCEEI